MGVDKIIYGIVIFSLVIITAMMTVVDLNNNYPGVTISSSDLNNLSSTANAVNGTVDSLSLSMKCSILGSTDDSCKDVSGTTTENEMFSGGFGAIRSVKSIFTAFGQFVNAIWNIIPIPTIYKVFATAGFLILVTYAVILIVFRIRG